MVLPPGAPAFAYAEHNIQASYVPPGNWEPSPEALQEAHAMSRVMDPDVEASRCSPQPDLPDRVEAQSGPPPGQPVHRVGADRRVPDSVTYPESPWGLRGTSGPAVLPHRRAQQQAAEPGLHRVVRQRRASASHQAGLTLTVTNPRRVAQAHPMEDNDPDNGEVPAGAGAPLVAPDGQVFVREVSGGQLIP